LAKKPQRCLEYIVAHELLHLVERTHSARFIALLDRHMPRWKIYRAELNRATEGDATITFEDFARHLDGNTDELSVLLSSALRRWM
jgi:hypothetical protein